MYTELVMYVLGTLCASFLCSMWEAVLLSISPAYMQIAQREGARTGQILQEFSQNIEKPLAALLTMNTIANTVGAIAVGRTAMALWGDTYPTISGLVVPASMTILILLLGEVIPKTLASKNWRALVPFTLNALFILMRVLAPLVLLCQLVTNLFKAKNRASVFSRADLLAMTEIGEAEGKLDEMEADYIHNLLKFRELTAKDVMTPRPVLLCVPQTITCREFYDTQDRLSFSRVPLLDSASSDSIVGYCLKDEILELIIDGKGETQLGSIKRNLSFVLEDCTIFSLFNTFIERREHLALVGDEYGSTLGLVTMEDVFETLLGEEIVDETDTVVDMQEFAKEKWKERG